MNLLTIDEVLELHRDQIEEHGGSHGIRDRGLLESAVAQQTQSFGGVELHSTLAEKVSAVGYSLIANHPFFDGNKRIGLAVIELTLRMNGCNLGCSDDVLEKTVLEVAKSNMSRSQLAEWIAANLVEYRT